MKIIQTTAQEMGKAYSTLFIEIFGEQREHHMPDWVWLFVTDDDTDIMGFAEGFEIKKNEIFLQFGGARKQYRGFSTKKRLREVRDYLHQKYKYIITSVENTNQNMLRLYLSIGYLIYGLKISTDHKTFLELISTRE